jgi:hypothetical protein
MVRVRIVDRVCYTITIVSLLAAVVIALVMIWGSRQDDEWLWKGLLTTSVFFLASALMLSINRMLRLGMRRGH